MEDTAEVPATALWATSASFNLSTTANASQIRVNTRRPPAVFRATLRCAVPLPTVAIQGRCASIAVVDLSLRVFLSSPRPVQIPQIILSRFLLLPPYKILQILLVNRHCKLPKRILCLVWLLQYFPLQLPP